MPDKKLLVLSPIPEDLIKLRVDRKVAPGELDGASITGYKGASKAELIKSVADADVIVGDYTGTVVLDEEVLRAARRCILVQQPSTGFESVDTAAAARLGIPVANIGGANASAVAEHALMLILACLKKLTLAHEKTMRGEWTQNGIPGYGVFELRGRTLGIIGMGRIGREVAKRARTFGPRLVYCSRHRLDPDLESSLDAAFRPLDELIAQSDVITIHTPLTPETANLIDAGRIAMMKPDAIIINVSRGAILDEAALAAALREKRIGGAGLDVFAQEPISAANPLLHAPNIILTPHIAGATNESQARIIDATIDNVVRVLRGQEPADIVNGVKPRLRP
jgi:phosphoglycerate dehydrogenase-like enzyme